MKTVIPRRLEIKIVLGCFALVALLVALPIFIYLPGVEDILAREPFGDPVSGDTSGAPPGCEAEAVASRIRAALAAISRGDADVVEEYFGRARGAPFQWYSIEGFVARSWEELSVYFHDRHQNGERLELVRVRFNSWEKDRGLVHFGPIVVKRSARDIDLAHEEWKPLAEGKGAYHCETTSIVVLSLGMRDA